MGCKELARNLLKTTHYYVRILLYSERIVKESNDRTLLKNLGAWLGMLTFSRNKAVLCKELEVKQVWCMCVRDCVFVCVRESMPVWLGGWARRARSLRGGPAVVLTPRDCCPSTGAPCLQALLSLLFQGIIDAYQGGRRCCPSCPSFAGDHFFAWHPRNWIFNSNNRR